MYEKIKRWYTLGLWTEEMVHNSVEKGIITADEAAEILS